MKWDKLCHSKESGGLGFRDLKTFNLALLAKQGWRILQQPQSLVARVFKAKYFHSCGFMEADIGHRPSYAWRSIAMAHEMLQLGMRWHIGNGRSVRIWHDPWLPLKESSMVQSVPQILDPEDTVSTLIFDDNNMWNVEKVREVFSEWEANAIVSIPLPPHKRRDRLFWDDTKSGLFSVKSAYHFQLRHRAAARTGECSEVRRDRKFWKFLWALSIPPKVKSFLWRACNAILPTNAMLHRRHMRKDDCCPCCCYDFESVEHALWSCLVANDVWAESKLKVLKWDRCVYSFCELINNAQSRLDPEDMELFCCVTYFIWMQRNRLVHDACSCNPKDVMQRAAKLICDFREASAVSFPSKSAILTPELPKVWSPPDGNVFKVNWEVVVDSSHLHWWVGILIRMQKVLCWLLHVRNSI